MKSLHPLILSSLLLPLTLATGLAETLFDSNEHGLNVFVDSGLTAKLTETSPEPDGNETLILGGDPTNEYSKFYNPAVGGPSFTLLAVNPEDYNKTWTLSYDVYLPTDSQVADVNAQVQFLRDDPPNYKLDFDGDDANKIQQPFYSTAKLNQPDQWQTIQLTGTVPEVDQDDVAVNAARFYIEFKQTDAAANTTPLKAYIRNIKFIITEESAPAKK